MTPSTNPSPIQPRRRADAERSVARILDGAVDALASDPEASMAEIARRAGVVRATIYVHFPTRESLIDAVTQRAMSEVIAVIEAAEPQRGDPVDALARVLSAAWRGLGRYHALVGINTRLPQTELHHRHSPLFAILEPLVERGQEAGKFRSDVPAAWHLAMIMALIHAAVAELQAEHLPPEKVESALRATILGAVTGA
jgi:TetR/AcrR family transcriptional regulator, mexCD-oprJ operon repressor